MNSPLKHLGFDSSGIPGGTRHKVSMLSLVQSVEKKIQTVVAFICNDRGKQ